MARAASLALAGLLFASPASAQERPEDGAQPTFRLIRYEEDWSTPLDEHANTYDRLKRIGLGDSGRFLSLGGDLRTRHEYFRHPDFGLERDQDDFLLLRGLVHADLHLHGFRAYVQLGTMWMLGESGSPGPLDEDRLDLQQGFAEVRGDLWGGHALIRVGRQEIVLGSQRLVSVRKGPNLRRSFDALRIQWSRDDVQIDVLGGLTVQPEIGVFDNAPNTDEGIWSVHTTFARRGPKLLVDAYYMGVYRRDSAVPTTAGNEHRHSLGSRVFGRAGPVDFNVEGVLQLGRLGDAHILAWTLATDTGLNAQRGQWRMRLGARANVASGDTQAGDERIETFDALFPKLKYFSESGLVFPSNFLDVHPIAQLSFRQVELSVGWDVLWRYSTADTVYRPSRQALVEADVSPSRFIGHQLVAELSVPIDAHFALTFYYARFWVGAFLRAGGARDVDFFGSWIELTV